MITTAPFEYKKFIALSGLDLCHYMEPLLSDRATVVSVEDLHRIFSELPTYDEYHLVYGLTLGAKHSPETFAMQLPLYLAHRVGSVRCTALNSLAQVPGKYVTNDLADLLRKVHSSYPANPWITDALGTLEMRLREERK